MAKIAPTLEGHVALKNVCFAYKSLNFQKKSTFVFVHGSK
jgi:hypothetical protein